MRAQMCDANRVRDGGPTRRFHESHFEYALSQSRGELLQAVLFAAAAYDRKKAGKRRKVAKKDRMVVEMTRSLKCVSGEKRNQHLVSWSSLGMRGSVMFGEKKWRRMGRVGGIRDWKTKKARP